MDAFTGSILLVPYTFAPANWAFCNGQSMRINQYSALFALIGTYFGGDGTTSFNLPDLRSRVPIGAGQGQGLSLYNLGQTAGAENVQLTLQQLAAHNHGMVIDASPGSDTGSAGDNIAQVNTGTIREPTLSPSFTSGSPAAAIVLNAGTIQSQGGNQGHPNIQPVLALNYIICLNGIFPTRS